MRLPRMRIQWLMIWILVAGILTWGMPSLISEARRRWNNCQSRAAYHASLAVMYERWANGITERGPDYTRVKDLSDSHAGKSKEYNRAMYRPWVMWSLGD